MDNDAALRRVFEIEDTLKRRLAVLAAMRKSLGKKHWESKGLRSYPDFDSQLRCSVFTDAERG